MLRFGRLSKTLATFGFVTMTGFLLDLMLFAEGVPRREVVLLSDLIAGILAATLIYVLEESARQREHLVEARLRVISEMNHHIRNALQVILFHSASAADQSEIQEVKESIDRIQWALREILPTLPEK